MSSALCDSALGVNGIFSHLIVFHQEDMTFHSPMYLSGVMLFLALTLQEQ